ncbi:type II/IV secretion system protein [candidate division WWE3 bacterium]|jgi:type IV pilus assembly protein PilB|uniref:Type II/IV secretion system protein n=1 Tax=candidate division WWE3 bacterium TaxID=2053526 RepID=A0A3A4ZHK2_UNCKA|nr:MAG: type II/IV secretion system protein [candidate division WWE3 bacterium]
MFQIDTVKTVADVLFEKKFINSDQLSAIKFEHVNTGKSLESIIRERGYVGADDFAQAFGEAYGIEYVNVNPHQIEPTLLDSVPLAVARKYHIVPFDLKDNKLSLAMADPLDLQTIDFVERKTGYKVVPFIATEKNIEKVLEDQKGKELGEEISAALEELSQNTLKIEETNQEITDATIRDAPIARIVGMVLETAVKTGASDIHLEPGEDKSRLRYRIDGILEEKRTIPKEMHDSVIARIKILAKMKIDEKRVPQDGRFKVEVGNTQTDLRVSTLPTIYGEKVVIRLLKEEGTVFTFRDLGMRGLTLRRFEEVLLKPNGMILVTGPTGSGKTVTLASALAKLNTVRVNIVTLEDPVEIRVAGVNQVQINPQAGLTFANGLRSFLRQDPNIIMVGEVRDGETAELAVHAALTGHLVLSTLHTNSASGALPRLIDMAVESFLLSSTLNGVLAQRLVRRVCQDCKETIEPPDEVKESIAEVVAQVAKNKILMTKDTEVAKVVKEFTKEKATLAKGKGCSRCGNTGYRGRLGIFEMLPMSDTIAHHVLENDTANMIEAEAINEGMLTLLQDGFLRVVEGQTSLEEVMRVAK